MRGERCEQQCASCAHRVSQQNHALVAPRGPCQPCRILLFANQQPTSKIKKRLTDFNSSESDFFATHPWWLGLCLQCGCTAIIKTRQCYKSMTSALCSCKSCTATRCEVDRRAWMPLSPPQYHSRAGSTTNRVSNGAASAARRARFSSPAQLGTPGALPNAITSVSAGGPPGRVLVSACSLK